MRQEIPEKLLGGPFRSSDAVASGLTYKQLKSHQFRHVFHDVYVSADVPDSVGLRCSAAALLLPPSAVFCDVTAARLYRLPVPDRDDRVHVAVPAGTPTPPRVGDIVAHRYRLPPEQLATWDGRVLVRPERLFLELAAVLPRMGLLIAGDAMLRSELTDLLTLSNFLQETRRRRGVARARNAVPHLEPRTDSPQETWLRMVLIDGGLPRPRANVDVYDAAGQWIARPDLLYEEAKIAIDYDGAHHRLESEQYSNDLTRGNLLMEAGYLHLRYDNERLFLSPHRIVAEVRNLLLLRLGPSALSVGELPTRRRAA